MSDLLFADQEVRLPDSPEILLPKLIIYKDEIADKLIEYKDNIRMIKIWEKIKKKLYPIVSKVRHSVLFESFFDRILKNHPVLWSKFSDVIIPIDNDIRSSNVGNHPDRQEKFSFPDILPAEEMFYFNLLASLNNKNESNTKGN